MIYECWCGFKSDERASFVKHGDHFKKLPLRDEVGFRRAHIGEELSCEKFNELLDRLNEIGSALK